MAGCGGDAFSSDLKLAPIYTIAPEGGLDADPSPPRDAGAEHALEAGDVDAGDDAAADAIDEAPDDASRDAHADAPACAVPCGASCCHDQACVAGACSGVCSPGATQCTGPNIQQCDGSGQWAFLGTCTDPVPVCLQGGCVACAPGTVQCAWSGTATQQCGPTGSWDTPTMCTGGASCVGGACEGGGG